ncbi:hypothetical protein BDR03DRAFT_731357 [Suillus americanus]|nr:hypothetical protein BDR03DRAFT_731357 [Suillus americanus]
MVVLAMSSLYTKLYHYLSTRLHMTINNLLQLAHSQVIIPDLETQYPVSNTHYSAFNLNYQNISAIITERQQQLDAASHEISRLETVIDGINHIHQQLVAKKDEVTQSMNSHKRLVSALWRLPAEVLSQIFAHCLPNERCLSPASKAAPMLLTRVCRRWREVAVDMSSLWQGLYVDKDWQRAAFCYESWLKRSRGRPLSLGLKCYGGNWTELRSLLQPYINQVSSLTLSLDFLHHAQSEVMVSDFLALEKLNICLNSNSVACVVQSISQPPSTLRSLAVTVQFFNVEYATAFNPAWTHLTNIHIDLDEPSAFPLLLRCPSLSSLTIFTYFTAMEALEPFTHTQLQSLWIISDDSYDDDTEYLNLFDTLSLPNLRSLEVCDVYSFPHEEFKAFLTRSKCPLEILALSCHV